MKVCFDMNYYSIPQRSLRSVSIIISSLVLRRTFKTATILTNVSQEQHTYEKGD